MQHVIDLTDAQWSIVAPLLPRPSRIGRPRADDRRTLNGILYVLRSGCHWQDVPRRYGAPTTCWRRFRRWQEMGAWPRIWQAVLKGLDDQSRDIWAQAFLGGSFAPNQRAARRAA